MLTKMARISNDWNTNKIGYQLGYRGYNFFGLNDFMVQVEYNDVPTQMYETSNPRLNYSHYNLPLAHVKGSGFRELIIRANYEYDHWFVDLRTALYNFFSSIDDFSPQHVTLRIGGADVAIDQTMAEVGVTVICWPPGPAAGRAFRPSCNCA